MGSHKNRKQQPPYTELGTFSFTYRSLDVHGMGISASSNFAVLYQAMFLALKSGPPLDRNVVASAALQFERRLARHLAVAADDVYPITFGGVQKIRTLRDGSVEPKAVKHNPQWIADHVVIAMNPKGKRHDVPDLLHDLLKHRNAKAYVQQFSRLAEQASMAITHEKADDLVKLVNKYRIEFNRWMEEATDKEQKYSKVVDGIASALERQVRGIGWKPPGGGASESLMVVCPDKESRNAVIQFFIRRQWHAQPALVTSGICAEFIRTDADTIRITAGHRLDFVGAADLGQQEGINENGCCCSCAIEPRTEIVVSNNFVADYSTTPKRRKVARHIRQAGPIDHRWPKHYE